MDNLVFRKKHNNLSEDFWDFSENIIDIKSRLSNGHDEHVIVEKLLQSALSAGANYEVACSAESNPDFVNKLREVLEDMQESHIWLKLIQQTPLSSDYKLKDSIVGYEKLTEIIANSVVSAN